VSRFTVLRVANRSKETSSTQSENAEPETDLDAIMSTNNVHLHSMSSQKLLEILRVVAPFVECVLIQAAHLSMFALTFWS
jgi:hypothetical protein